MKVNGLDAGFHEVAKIINSNRTQMSVFSEMNDVMSQGLLTIKKDVKDLHT